MAAMAAGVRTTWLMETERLVTAMLLFSGLEICNSSDLDTPGASKPFTDPDTPKFRLTSRTCNCPGAALETIVPLPALTVKSVFATGVVVAVPTVSVACAVPPEVRFTDVGAKLAFTPAGNPVVENVTGPVKPPVDVAETVNVVDWPWSTVRLEGDNATVIPKGAFAVLPWPLLAASAAVGTIATKMASSNARRTSPRRDGTVRSGRWSMEALFGRWLGGVGCGGLGGLLER